MKEQKQEEQRGGRDRTERTVDVMEARHADLDAKVLLVVHAQLLSDQLLQSVRVLRLRGPCIALLQRRHMRFGLHTGRGTYQQAIVMSQGDEEDNGRLSGRQRRFEAHLAVFGVHACA